MKLRTERDRVAHLLRRFGLGASEAEMDYYGKDGLKGAIDRLLDYASVPEQDLDVDAFASKKGALKPQSVRAWWMHKLLTTQRPLEEKMTLFWHDHFATSVDKVDNPSLMYGQNETIRASCTGKFPELLANVSKDPAMMFWLDNQLNEKGKPNENFGREVMELFTLGIGNYTEKDVQEGARAFTGWRYSVRRGKKANPNSIKGGRPVFVFDESTHDSGTKTFLGQTGDFDGDDILKILCAQPACAKFLTKKIWTWFVYEKPDASTVDAFATKFKNSGLDIKALLRAIMESDEFYSDRAARRLYKTPVDFTIATLRQLGVGAAELRTDAEGALVPAALRPVQTLMLSTKAMGMELLAPPDVSGWDGGQAWISTATVVERIKWADRIFGDPPGAAKGAPATIRLPAAKLFDDGNPMAVAKKLCSILDADLPEGKVAQIAEAIRQTAGGDVTAANANAAADAGTRLIFGSPEFQFF